MSLSLELLIQWTDTHYMLQPYRNDLEHEKWSFRYAIFILEYFFFQVWACFPDIKISVYIWLHINSCSTDFSRQLSETEGHQCDYIFILGWPSQLKILFYALPCGAQYIQAWHVTMLLAGVALVLWLTRSVPCLLIPWLLTLLISNGFDINCVSLILRENHHASVVWNWHHWVAILRTRLM